MANKLYDGDIGGGIALGIVCFAICVGIGTCNYQWDKGIALRQKVQAEKEVGIKRLETEAKRVDAIKDLGEMYQHTLSGADFNDFLRANNLDKVVGK